MRAFLILLCLLPFAAQANFCKSFAHADGRVRSEKELMDSGLLERGVWITFDYREYESYPEEIRAALRKYARTNQILMRDFIQRGPTVHELTFRSGARGLYVQVGDLLGFASTTSGAVYRRDASQLTVVATVEQGHVTRCRE